MDKKIPIRKELRLEGYDYSTPGAYFLTFCTYNRKNTLSQIVGKGCEQPVLQLSSCGEIVDKIINGIPSRFCVTVDKYVIMPNHVHLLVTIAEEDAQRAIRESPLRGRSIISKVVGYIKMNTAKEIRQMFGNVRVWQRGFYDHIIRGSYDYDEIAKYIEENPIRWELDKLYSKG